MLEKFEIKDNPDREKVIEYIRKSKFKLKYFEVKDYSKYPGGIQLVDSEKRSIIIYYDELFEKIRVVYKELKKVEDDVKFEISFHLWDKYSILAQDLKQAARLERKKGMIQYYRYDIENPKNKVHVSQIFHEASQVYDIYYYLERQIRRLEVEKEELC